MAIFMFLVAIALGGMVTYTMAVPLWLVGPITGIYVWWLCSDDPDI